ncbi:MAG: hypothetical protein H6618_10135 [Deltaproteobacteria bacterium]|nr:hypothetical protein [Deltaproteobacteria bacterium]
MRVKGLKISSIPALASHTLAVIIGFSLATVSPQQESPGHDGGQLPARGQVYLTIPPSMIFHEQEEKLAHGHLLSLLQIGKGDQNVCILEQAIMKHIRSKPAWVVQARSSDLPRLIRIYHPSQSRQLKVAAADLLRDYPPCPKTPEVRYGNF